ncbi:carboxylesterase/lipase family protein [Paralcaligenes ureilyticus]|uniref:Carboxylic ester hydrolase n=1 Tax=Paralcaligenes ureilyticus TaxID=627131 RepID=A0A4R3M741_9BURK|nr:carboxylesterase/lipase family protein [Paralcaligenes ureilyticus]TCT07397.1 para-nitrobenzyl esterase [Paralcaligenes ureilyticus]
MSHSNESSNCYATIPHGVMKGSRVNGVCIYRGIPYAQPMVGDLRFNPPLPAKPWQGDYDATQDRPIAPQNRSRLAAAMGDFSLPQNEDCLTLDICTPAADPGKLPVVVWIHGGAFSSGAGSLPWYSGENMARNGQVVTVSINYRLGALGFLYLPGFCDGNLGLKDQVLAVQWVKDHIHHFGGDPDNITLIGQSAGGGSIAALLTMPNLDGLFRRAILQSASIGRLFTEPDEAEKMGHSFLKILDISRHEAHKLKQIAVQDLLKAQQSLAVAEHKLAQTKPPFWLVRDGEFICNELSSTLEGDRKLNIDLLIGTTREEMAAFYHFDSNVQNADDSVVKELFRKEFGQHAAMRLDAYTRRRAVPTSAAILGDMYTDKVFRHPSLQLAESFSSRKLVSYVYEFDWQSPGHFEACHCLEIPFVFNNLEKWDDAPMLDGLDKEEFRGLSNAMQKAWVAFAYCGNPNHAAIPKWDSYTPETRSVMHFDRLIAPQTAHFVGEGNSAP